MAVRGYKRTKEKRGKVIGTRCECTTGSAAIGSSDSDILTLMHAAIVDISAPLCPQLDREGRHPPAQKCLHRSSLRRLAGEWTAPQAPVSRFQNLQIYGSSYR
jgi:hypothetical protein